MVPATLQILCKNEYELAVDGTVSADNSFKFICAFCGQEIRKAAFYVSTGFNEGFFVEKELDSLTCRRFFTCNKGSAQLFYSRKSTDFSFRVFVQTEFPICLFQQISPSIILTFFGKNGAISSTSPIFTKYNIPPNLCYVKVFSENIYLFIK